MSKPSANIRRVDNGWIVISYNVTFSEKIYSTLEEALKEVAWVVGNFCPGDLKEVIISTKQQPVNHTTCVSKITGERLPIALERRAD